MTNPLEPYLDDSLRLDASRLQVLSRLSKRLITSNCQACSLHTSRGSVAPVPGAGRGRILFIGHRIGQTEAFSGEPAVGKASVYGFHLFRQAIAPNAPVSEKDSRDVLLDYCYVTNGVRCGHDDDVNPNHGTWKKCSKKWMEQEIALIDPVIIVFWQKAMVKSILGPRAEIPPTGTIGETYVYGRKYPIMVMNHPVAISHEPTYHAVVESQFATLANWLFENGYLKQAPPRAAEASAAQSGPEHVLVETPEQLQAMVTDLAPKTWLSLDCETSFRGKYGELTAHELKLGAVLWHAEGFQIVTVQIAGMEEDGSIRRTYTIPIGFRKVVGNEMQFSLDPDQVRAALNWLFSQKPADAEQRILTMWNAEFDCSVMTRFGVDLLGFTHQAFPLQVIDGQLVLVRYNEHLADINQLSLDAAGRLFLLEGKGGSFKSHFDPLSFPYEDMSNPRIRQTVLDYAGGDVDLTLRLTTHLLNELQNHIVDTRSHTTTMPSPLPAIGCAPFPRPASVYTTSRLRDVTIPIDHQMVPIIAEMEMLGFRIDQNGMREVDRYAREMEHELLSRIHATRSGLNPKSPAHLRAFLEDVLEELANRMQTLIDTLRAQGASMLAVEAVYDAYQINARRRAVGRLTGKTLRDTFEDAYGALDTKQATVEEKLLVYLTVSDRLLGQSVPATMPGFNLIQASRPLIDDDAVEQFFSLVYLYNQLNKKTSTYLDRFRRLADRHNVFHPEYRSTTTTGRLNGNFQNIPRGADEDEEWTEKVLVALNHRLPTDDEERKAYIRTHNRLDVRQYISAIQADDLNRQFSIMNLPWRVAHEEYVLVSADFAAQEDRMAYALSGDRTKERLLANPNLDTHFYNVAFCFGGLHGFDTKTEEGVMAAYEYFVKNKSKYKALYRQPMKTVHYASQYGAGDQKLHSLLGPLFAKQGTVWSFDDTQRLKAAYDDLYAEVTATRENLIRQLDTIPYLEYPIFGTIRHAKGLKGRVHTGEHLSVANAINQGTSAYTTKTAMIRMRHLIYMNAQRWGLVQAGGSAYAGLVIQVHDEIGVLCPKRLAPEIAYALESAMKIIVGPPIAGKPAAYWDDTQQDHRGETGWLYISDPAFRGVTLFDAEAEVKTHLAKGKVLPSGAKNILATTDDPSSLERLLAEAGGSRIPVNAPPLVLCRAGFSPMVF